MVALPTGTVTFLFTDVEGSTALLERLGEAYADELQEHRAIVREAVSSNGGRSSTSAAMRSLPRSPTRPPPSRAPSTSSDGTPGA